MTVADLSVFGTAEEASGSKTSDGELGTSCDPQEDLDEHVEFMDDEVK